MYCKANTLTFKSPIAQRSGRAAVATLSDLWGLFQAADVGRSSEKRRERAAMFGKHIEPTLGTMPLAKITQGDIEQLLQGLENLHVAHARQKAIQAGHPEQLATLAARPLGSQRNRVLSLLSGMFRFALMRGLIRYSPIIQSAALKIKEQPRTRELKAEELRRFFRWLDRPDGEDRGIRIAMQLVLLLWRRASEVTQATWSEYDLEERRWTLPPHRNKGNQPIVLPLPDKVMALLSEARQLAGDSAFLFPSRYRVGGTGQVDRPVHRKSHEDALARYFAACPGDAFRLHDLRRTGRTRAARLGVAKHIGRMILGHARSSVDDLHYDMNDYQQEISNALTTWQQDVLRLAGKGALT